METTTNIMQNDDTAMLLLAHLKHCCDTQVEDDEQKHQREQ